MVTKKSAGIEFKGNLDDYFGPYKRRTRKNAITSPYRLKSAERKVEALELRKQGMTYAEIAEALGLKTSDHAAQIVHRALRTNVQEATDNVRLLELHRLDALLYAVWEQATAGEPKAVDRALRIMERRARLLGLDITHEQPANSQAIQSIQIKTIVAILPEGMEPMTQSIIEISPHALNKGADED